MTTKEAIENLKYLINDDCTDTQFDYENEIQLAIKALEKQIPKKPDYEGDGYDDSGNIDYDTWICPNCNHKFEVYYEHYEYCPDCGQALDWSDIKK